MFATNEIFHVYSKTKWRPTYYFIEDVVGARDNFSNEKEFKNIINQSEKVFAILKQLFMINMRQVVARTYYSIGYMNKKMRMEIKYCFRMI